MSFIFRQGILCYTLTLLSQHLSRFVLPQSLGTQSAVRELDRKAAPVPWALTSFLVWANRLFTVRVSVFQTETAQCMFCDIQTLL